MCHKISVAYWASASQTRFVTQQTGSVEVPSGLVAQLQQLQVKSQEQCLITCRFMYIVDIAGGRKRGIDTQSTHWPVLLENDNNTREPLGKVS